MSTKQRTNLKFLVRLGKNSNRGSRSTPASLWNRFVWNGQDVEFSSCTKWFKEGRENVEDDPRSGRLSTGKTEENVEWTRQKVHSDRRLTVRMIANELSMISERVWTIITEELEMRKICEKMVPRLLTDEQKEWRVQVCQDILTRLETDPNLLGRTITGDESWIFKYDPFTKRQNHEWKSPTSPRQKKVRMSKSKVKVILIAFFDMSGIVHKEILPQCQTINQHIYKDILSMSGVWCSQCVRKGKNCGMRNHGCFITTMPHHTMLWASGNSLSKITLLLWINLIIPLIRLPVTFLFPKLKGTIKGTKDLMT